VEYVENKMVIKIYGLKKKLREIYNYWIDDYSPLRPLFGLGLAGLLSFPLNSRSWSSLANRSSSLIWLDRASVCESPICKFLFFGKKKSTRIILSSPWRWLIIINIFCGY